MGNLSNLYISQSFISLIHLGSNNTASVTPTQLEDGLGNGIGVSVSTNGNLYVSGNVYATNLTGSVIDSSSFVTTASFNAYTQSTNNTIATLATTASVNSLSASIYSTDSTQSNLINGKLDTSSFNTFSSSQFQIEVSQSQQISASFATASAYSASLQISILAVSNSVSTSTGNTTTLSASIYQTDTTQSFQIGANAATASGFSASLSTTITNNSASTFQTDATQSTNINSLTALTSSYVRNNQNNTYSAGTTQSFDYITAGTASITYLSVIYETSSVIYSSGSNILGDAMNDTQTLVGRTIMTGSSEVTGSLKVSSDISSSTISGIGNVTLFSASVDSRLLAATGSTIDTGSLVTTASFNTYTASQDFKNTTFATTSSVNSLSASLYFTDTTQSVNIASNSSSIGLLQTFSGSQYKNDSSSFDSRIIAATGSTINTGSFITTGSATTASQTILGDFKFDTSYTASITTPSQGGGSNILYVDYSNYADSVFSAWSSNSFIGVIVNGTGVTNATITSVGFGSYVELTLSSGTVTNLANYTLSGPATQIIDITGSLSVTNNILTSGSSGHTIINQGTALFQNADDSFATQLSPADIQAQINTGDIIGMTPSASANTGLDGTWKGPSIYTAYDGAYRPLFGFQSQNTWTDGRITALKPLVVSGSLLQTGSTSFSELTGSLASFSSSVDSRLLAAGGAPQVQDEGTILGDATSFNFLGAGVTASFSAGTASITIPGGGGSIDTGSFAVTSSNAFTGQQTLTDVDKLNQITLGQQSGSLVLFGKGFTSSSLANITASSAAAANIIFKNNNNTPTTIVSGSSNIFTNPAAATATFNRYIGGSNNIINSTNTPQISQSMAFSPTMANNYINAAVTMRGPVSSSAWTISNNIVNFALNVGNSTANEAAKAVAGVTITSNIFNNTMNIIANKSLLTQPVSITNNQTAFTATTLTAASSSIVYGSNVGGITITNSASGGLVASQSNAIYVNANLFAGTGHTITATGSQDAGDLSGNSYLRHIEGNQIFGQSNGVNLPYAETGSNSLNQTIIAGYNLGVTGSNASSFSGLAFNQGSAFFGRYNAQTGNSAQSAQTVFAVGTGTSTSNRKTAFLIDSASVVNVSGSLSVTGSSTFNGSMVVTGSLVVTGSGVLIDSSANITAGAVSSSNIRLTGGGSPKVFFPPLTFGTSSYVPQVAVDGFQFYQNQGKPYAFQVNTQCDQYNGISGSQFTMTLQTNGSGNSTFGGANYFALISGSLSQSLDGGTQIKGGDVLANTGGGLELVYNYAYAGFAQKVYMDKGLYVSGSGGGASAALTINTNGGDALSATGSVKITGSLTLNGQTGFASLDSNTFTNQQTVSSSIYIASNNNNNQLYLPSGSNKQTGTFVLNGGNPGTATISNSNVTANSLIFLTKQSNANSGNGTVSVTSKGSGTFSVTSDHNGDADEVAFMIINPS
jgi:hypothetical protein